VTLIQNPLQENGWATKKGKNVMEDRKFQIQCDASADGQLHVKTDALSIRIGQRVRRDGSIELWDSVIVLCQSNEDGSLTTKIIVCHPDWDRHLQIANIQSHPQNGDQSCPPLQVDLKPAHL
jgi:hypothetical protein